ncbi:cytochrome c-550 PedF [Oceanospirillum sediminis]|uniref:Cytochrome c-550 PedF n=1 Tax=Oceanospirillum sediminis TaxID=2760088 RepID=A0A839IQP7_9GAMM|nr:cytochrome c-550 PedF [Oceanospirillum sediminis]MBB1486819.1 cytochrome c-550 PedF [Oceanospirillum sediminis]
MTVKTNLLRTGAAMVFGSLLSAQVFAHGDVVPQAIDTSMLPQLGEEWLEENPYTDNKDAIRIGESAYAQNCARCHGLDGISGGIAPDLRYLEPGYDGDEWFVYRVRNGAVRNGVPYMPKMAEHLSQEALWSIRAWLETKYVEQ